MKSVAAALLATCAFAPAQAGTIFEQTGRAGPYFDILLPRTALPPISIGSYEVKVEFDKDFRYSAGGSYMWVRSTYQIICPDPNPLVCGRNNFDRWTYFERNGDRELVGRFDVLPIRSDDRYIYYLPDEFMDLAVVASPTDGSFEMGYRLTISDLAAVPEPASWAMMIGGFALAGAAMRRRVQRPTYA